MTREPPQLLSSDEAQALLTRAENLWSDLQKNNLGGFSGINRPFYIAHEFRRVIEEFGNRDVGLNWSKDQLDALSSVESAPSPATTVQEGWPATCDGVEQDAFEEWAKGERFDMNTHPIHWLFLNAETAAARKGWKAGLLHAANRLAALSPAKAVEPAPEQGVDLRLEWRDGPPPKPWSGEWFIAETTFRDRVVLTALPEEYAYDFKTADDTYIMADRITRWMQFPDSQYIAPDAHPSPAPQQPQSEGLDDKGDAGEAYKRGIYDAKCWLRDQQHKNPPDSLWHAAAILADRMDVALLAHPPAQPQSEKMKEVLEVIRDEGMRNHNTRCREWWPQVLSVLSGLQS